MYQSSRDIVININGEIISLALPCSILPSTLYPAAVFMVWLWSVIMDVELIRKQVC